MIKGYGELSQYKEQTYIRNLGQLCQMKLQICLELVLIVASSATAKQVKVTFYLPVDFLHIFKWTNRQG